MHTSTHRNRQETGKQQTLRDLGNIDPQTTKAPDLQRREIPAQMRKHRHKQCSDNSDSPDHKQCSNGCLLSVRVFQSAQKGRPALLVLNWSPHTLLDSKEPSCLPKMVGTGSPNRNEALGSFSNTARRTEQDLRSATSWERRTAAVAAALPRHARKHCCSCAFCRRASRRRRPAR